MKQQDDDTVAAAAAGVAVVARNNGASLQPPEVTYRKAHEAATRSKKWSRTQSGNSNNRRSSSSSSSAVMTNLTKWIVLFYLLCQRKNHAGIFLVVQAQEQPLYTFSYDNANTSYRTNVCDRFRAVQRGELPFRTALRNVALVPLMRPASQFNLLEDGRIDSIDPGMMALLLDEIARRAGFTWRDSFGIYYDPGENKTWTDLLFAATQQYDFLPDYWGVTSSRLEMGVSFPHGYYDSSLILVAKKLEVNTKDTVVLFNWLQPFEPRVWFAMLLTILYSALVYSFLEWCGDEHDNRTSQEWLSDSFYLSSLLFTQNFEFAPRSVATRLFAISMALWALLLTTTYTANLANFFVTKATIQREVSTIEGAVDRGYKICSWGGAWEEDWVKQRYPTVQLVSKIGGSAKEVFLGLINDECRFALSTQYTFERFEVDKDVNQNCTLEQVGDKYADNSGSFALFGDHGVYCTSLIGDVLNLHLQELELEGFLDELWAVHLDKLNNNFCDSLGAAVEEDAAAERRRQRRLLNFVEEDHLLDTENVFHYGQEQQQQQQRRRRRLKGKRNAAAAAGAGRFDVAGSQSLNIKNLAGSFVLHAVLSVLALILSCGQNLRLERRDQPPPREKGGFKSNKQETNQATSPKAANKKNESAEVVKPLLPWKIRFDPNRTSANTTATTTTTITQATPRMVSDNHESMTKKKVSVEEALILLDDMHKELKAKVLAVSNIIQSLDPKCTKVKKAIDSKNNIQEDDDDNNDSVCSFADEDNYADDDTFDPKPPSPPPPPRRRRISSQKSTSGAGRRRVSFSDQNPFIQMQIEEDQDEQVS